MFETAVSPITGISAVCLIALPFVLIPFFRLVSRLRAKL